jgi:putative endonuclease
MPYTVYIIYSKAIDQYYIGQTENLADRMYRHRNSGSRSTKKAKDWELMYKEQYETRSEAVRRETFIKDKKSRKFIEELLRSVG